MCSQYIRVGGTLPFQDRALLCYRSILPERNKRPLLKRALCERAYFVSKETTMEHIVPSIDWSTLRYRLCRKRQLSRRVFEETVEEPLDRLIGCCGSYSRGRNMAEIIGGVLLDAALQPRILVPCCHNYRGPEFAEGQAPLLVEKQVRFLREVVKILPAAKICFLIPDQEEESAAVVGLPLTTFRERVESSLFHTRSVVPFEWDVVRFSTIVPGEDWIEHKMGARILTNPLHSGRLRHFTAQRRTLQERQYGTLSPEEHLEKTAHTAGQYAVLAQYAVAQRALICNHTSPNLAWYSTFKAGVLHNPVSPY